MWLTILQSNDKDRCYIIFDNLQDVLQKIEVWLDKGWKTIHCNWINVFFSTLTDPAHGVTTVLPACCFSSGVSFPEQPRFWTESHCTWDDVERLQRRIAKGYPAATMKKKLKYMLKLQKRNWDSTLFPSSSL